MQALVVVGDLEKRGQVRVQRLQVAPIVSIHLFILRVSMKASALAVSASAPQSRAYFLYCFLNTIVILSGSEESLSLERVLVVKGILRWRSE